MARVVVVGGGFGGTAAAARLAKQGHDVTLVERRDVLGGALGFVERDGFRWDAGPTSTALPAVLRDLFRKSGRPLDRELDLVPVDPMREHRFEDGTTLAMPSGSRSAQLEAVDASLGEGLGERWVDFVHTFAETWDVLRRVYLERPWSPDHVDKASSSLLLTRTTLHKVVTRAFKDERLREVALLQTRLDGHDPRNVPSWMGLWPYVEQNFGVWTIPGGMGRLAEAMTKRLGERKVQVLLGTRARDLRIEGGRVVAVDTDQGALDADVVVVARRPARAPRAGPARRPHHARDPAGRQPPRPVRRRARPAARGGAARRPDCSWCARTAPPPRAARPGRCWAAAGSPRTSCWRWPGAGSTYASSWRCGWTVPRATQVEELAGSAYGVLWQGRSTIDPQGRRDAVRRRVRRRGARRGRCRAAVRGSVRRRRRRADRAGLSVQRCRIRPSGTAVTTRLSR